MPFWMVDKCKRLFFAALPRDLYSYSSVNCFSHKLIDYSRITRVSCALRSCRAWCTPPMTGYTAWTPILMSSQGFESLSSVITHNSFYNKKAYPRLEVDRDKPRNLWLWFMVLGLLFITYNVLLEHGELTSVLCWHLFNTKGYFGLLP